MPTDSGSIAGSTGTTGVRSAAGEVGVAESRELERPVRCGVRAARGVPRQAADLVEVAPEPGAEGVTTDATDTDPVAPHASRRVLHGQPHSERTPPVKVEPELPTDAFPHHVGFDVGGEVYQQTPSVHSGRARNNAARDLAQRRGSGPGLAG